MRQMELKDLGIDTDNLQENKIKEHDTSVYYKVEVIDTTYKREYRTFRLEQNAIDYFDKLHEQNEYDNDFNENTYEINLWKIDKKTNMPLFLMNFVENHDYLGLD